MVDEKTYGENYWVCEDCGWFIYPDALKFQEQVGTQSYPWRCPECGIILKQKE